MEQTKRTLRSPAGLGHKLNSAYKSSSPKLNNAIPFFPLSVCLSDCPPSCAVLGADLHRKCSRGGDRRQGLHHHLWGPRGHRGAVPGQVREPHQQVRERKGKRGPHVTPPPPRETACHACTPWSLHAPAVTHGPAFPPEGDQYQCQILLNSS